MWIHRKGSNAFFIPESSLQPPYICFKEISFVLVHMLTILGILYYSHRSEAPPVNALFGAEHFPLLQWRFGHHRFSQLLSLFGFQLRIFLTLMGIQAFSPFIQCFRMSFVSAAVIVNVILFLLFCLWFFYLCSSAFYTPSLPTTSLFCFQI